MAAVTTATFGPKGNELATAFMAAWANDNTSPDPFQKNMIYDRSCVQQIYCARALHTSHRGRPAATPVLPTGDALVHVHRT